MMIGFYPAILDFLSLSILQLGWGTQQTDRHCSSFYNDPDLQWSGPSG